MAELDLKVLEKLCLSLGISGDERAVADSIEQLVGAYADEIRRTPLGDLLVFRRGQKPAPKKLMLCARMDEVGLVIRDIDEKGFLRFSPVGSVESTVLLGKSVWVNGKIRGVIGGKPVHLMDAQERQKPVPMEQLTIDIGADSAQEAEKVCQIGDYVNFEPFFEVSGNIVKAKALDSRIACAVLIELIRGELPYDTWFAFTTRGQVGCIGARAAAYQIRPELVIDVEGTPAADVLGTSGPKAGARMGKGPALPIVDSGTVYDRVLYKKAFTLAKERCIPCQTRTGDREYNDAAAAHSACGGARAAAVGVSCRYVHGPCAMADLRDAGNALELIRALCAAMTEY